MFMKLKKWSKCIAVRRNSATPLRETHMPYGITQCYLTDVRLPPLPPAEAGTRFSDPGWYELTYMYVSESGSAGIEPRDL